MVDLDISGLVDVIQFFLSGVAVLGIGCLVWLVVTRWWK